MTVKYGKKLFWKLIQERTRESAQEYNNARTNKGSSH